MVGTTLPAVVRVVDLPTGTTVTGAELFEVVQTTAGVGQSVQLPLNQIVTGITGALPTGGGTGQILNKLSSVNFSSTWSNITQFVAVGTSLATTGSATSIVAFVPNQGITSTQILNNAVGTNQLASSIGIASSVSIGTLLTVTGTATFNGGIVGNGTLGITGNSVLTGTFGVIGTSLLTGTVGVVGTSQFTGAFNVVGTSVVTGSVSVVGSASFTGGTFGVQATSNFTGIFSVVGTTLFTSGTFGVVGTTLVTGTFGQVGTSLMTGTYGVVGTSQFTGLFTVVGTAAFTGGFNFNVIGTTQFTSGAFNVNGTTLFTSNAFGVVGTATFTSNAFGISGTAVATGQFGIVGSTVITGTLNVSGTATLTGTLILPALTSGFLQVSATGVVQTTTPGNFVLINTLTMNNVASTNDTSSFTNTYKNYLITLENVVPVTNTTFLQMQVATSGSNFISGNYVSQAITNIGSAGAPIDSSTTVLLLTGTRSTSSVQSSLVYGVSGNIRLYNPAGTIARKQMVAEISYQSTAGAVNTSTIALIYANGWFDGNNNAVTGVNFSFNSGNIATGTIKIYGMT